VLTAVGRRTVGLTQEVRDDIRATSENIIADARELTKIEERKLDLNADGVDLENLSEHAAEIANDLAQKAATEKRLVRLANAQDRLKRAGESAKSSEPKRRAPDPVSDSRLSG
jgi:hypothetical protein